MSDSEDLSDILQLYTMEVVEMRKARRVEVIKT